MSGQLGVMRTCSSIGAGVGVSQSGSCFVGRVPCPGVHRRRCWACIRLTSLGRSFAGGEGVSIHKQVAACLALTGVFCLTPAFGQTTSHPTDPSVHPPISSSETPKPMGRYYVEFRV